MECRRVGVLGIGLLLSAACGGVSTEQRDGGTADGAAGTLSVVETSPATGATDVEIAAPLEVTFSAALDPATVTADSVQVVHGGNAVDGTLSVDGDTVTFTPDVQWHLAAVIDVQLSTAITDAGGDALAVQTDVSFAVADGDWANAILIASSVNGFSLATSNLAGDIVFPYEDSEDNIRVVTYSPATQSFAPSQSIGNEVRAFSRPEAALNENGEAIVLWRGDINSTPPIIGWSRFDGATWDAGQTQTDGTAEANMSVGLGLDGTAIRATSAANAPDTFSRFLAPAASAWSADALVQSEARVWSARASGTGIQVIMEPDSGGLISRQFTPGANSYGPVSSIDAAGDSNFVTHSPLGDGDMSFSWMRDNIEIHQARFDSTTGAWTASKVGDGAGGSQVCENSRGNRIGVYRSGQTMFVRRADPGQDFGAAENLGSLNGVEYANCFLDESGNGHAFYGGFGDEPMTWARMSPDGAWSAPVSLGIPSGVSRGVLIDGFGNVSLIYVEGNQAFATRYQ